MNANSPKPELRSPKEIRRLTSEPAPAASNSRSCLGFRASIGFRISVFGFFLALLSQPSTLTTTPPPNRVLQLDGGKSYVELPTNLVANLSAATIECWVRWEQFVSDARVFDFGQGSRQFYISPDQTRPTFKATLADPLGGRHRLYVAGLWRLDRWCHIACVVGPGGMKLYYNGRLAVANEFEGGLAGLATNMVCLIGMHNERGNSNNGFRGQIDEFRIWIGARTEQQIREAMSRGWAIGTGPGGLVEF